MRKWRVDEVNAHVDETNRDIAEDWTVYFKLVDPHKGEDVWRVALCRSVHSGRLQLWSRGNPVQEDDGRFEQIWELAVTYYQLTGTTEGFPEQELDI